MMHKFRRLYAVLKENEMLIRIGAYHQGNDPDLDEAIEKKEKMENFLKQIAGEKLNFQQVLAALKGSVS
jgi:flagellum-specific ATP synthase